MSVDSVKIFNDQVKEPNDASSHRSLFLDKERYNNILRDVKEVQILRKNNQPLTSKHYRRLKRYDVMKIDDTQKLKVVQAKIMIRTFVITARWRSCLMSWKQHVNIGHKRRRGKTQCFVCDSQKHSRYLFLSKVLFLSFSHGS
jgi:hypothetical protein